MKKQSGFTLIELIIVIVILGILAAYAVPKYMELDRQARISVVKGLEGSIRAASDMVHSLAIAKNTTSGDLDVGTGIDVAVANGYATSNTNSNGIVDAIASDLSDSFNINVTAATNTVSFEKLGADVESTCVVTYRNPTNGTSPIISYTDTGC